MVLHSNNDKSVVANDVKAAISRFLQNITRIFNQEYNGIMFTRNVSKPTCQITEHPEGLLDNMSMVTAQKLDDTVDHRWILLTTLLTNLIRSTEYITEESQYWGYQL